MLMKHLTLLACAFLSLEAAAQITDGSFEAGIGAGTWNEASVNYGTPLCDAGCGTCGGPCVPNTGTFYAWFGGSGSNTEIGSVDQDAIIPTGASVNLVMMVKMPALGDLSSSNYLKAMVDGNDVGMITPDDSVTYMASYTQWTLPIDAYADGGTHNVKLEGAENGTTVFNVLVDDVALEVDGVIVIGLFENESIVTPHVYPNPTSESLNLAFNATQGDAVVTILDASGRTMSTERIDNVRNRSFQYDVSAFPDGIYMLSIAVGGKSWQERFVVNH